MTEVHQLPAEPGGPEAESLAERYWLLQKAGGLVAPLLTVLLAFLISGVVVLGSQDDEGTLVRPSVIGDVAGDGLLRLEGERVG